MTGSTLSRADYLARWSTLHGGYDPAQSRWVSGWLATSYAAATPFVRLRIPPDVVTVIGGLLAAVAIWPASRGGHWPIVAAVVIGLSGLFDGLDGAVAVISDRVTLWGAMLDSVVDRLGEVAMLIALWVAGAPAWVCIAAGVASWTLEYARARATAVGMGDTAVITIGERPTRIAIAAMFLLAAGVYVGSATTWLAVGAYAWLVTAAIGLLQFLWALRGSSTVADRGGK